MIMKKITAHYICDVCGAPFDKNRAGHQHYIENYRGAGQTLKAIIKTQLYKKGCNTCRENIEFDICDNCLVAVLNILIEQIKKNSNRSDYKETNTND